jgi:hypothetical protein
MMAKKETIKKGGFATGPMRAPVDLGAGPDVLDNMESQYTNGIKRMLKSPGRGRRNITDKVKNG